MRVCILGSGISGLSAAFYLSGYVGTEITIFEKANVLGGRANVFNGGEHCARIFLSDYEYLFEILKGIPIPDGRSVFDTLIASRRYCYSKKSGWIQTSHLYPMLAKELSLVDKINITMARRRLPLLAAQEHGPNSNRYGSMRNFTARSMVRMLANFLESKVAYVLEGPTDECLIAPWISFLEGRGVQFRKDTRIGQIRSAPGGVSVYSGDTWEDFDALVVTACAPDAIQLLDASGIEHSVKAVDHSHCKCFTITLDPREKVVIDGQSAIYSRRGVTVVLQPIHSRCVVFCTRKCPSTDASYVLSQVREYLALDYAIGRVEERDNQRPDEAIFTAEYVDPAKALARTPPNIFFAGSFIKNSYPVDSGEGAARSAFNAVQHMRSEFSLCRAS